MCEAASDARGTSIFYIVDTRHFGSVVVYRHVATDLPLENKPNAYELTYELALELTHAPMKYELTYELNLELIHESMKYELNLRTNNPWTPMHLWNMN